MLKLLAFDLDDTLYPEQSYINAGFKAVSAYMKQIYNIDEKEFYKKLQMIKKTKFSNKVFDIVLSQYRLLDRNLVEKLIKIYRSQPLKIRLFPGIKFTLSQLKKGFIISLITDGLSVVQKRKIDYLKIGDYFDSILYTLDHGGNFKKPSELPFRRILETYRINPRDALYIGNNPDYDFIGPRKVGIRTVRINQGIYKDRPFDKLHDADFTIKSIKELPILISKLVS